MDRISQKFILRFSLGIMMRPNYAIFSVNYAIIIILIVVVVFVVNIVIIIVITIT